MLRAWLAEHKIMAKEGKLIAFIEKGYTSEYNKSLENRLAN